jgi:ATP-dependent helicase/nuclease subunit A
VSATPIPQATLDAQRRASDPTRSAWVAAHAGSGKTHVLTRRVVRLLLDGAPPSKILCLTYTKAAAANMAERIFDILAKWTTLGDDALREAILQSGAQTVSAQDLEHARRLFARVVETPGGLKIQTIHAFCERILHLFPFEANAPAGFRVIDDMERAELLERARRRTLAKAIDQGDALHEALTRVAQQTTISGFDELTRELLANREWLRQIGDPRAHESALRKRLGLSGKETLASIEREMIDGGAMAGDWLAVASLLQQGSVNDRKLEAALRQAAALAPDAACLDLYLDVFFTQKGEPRGGEKRAIVTNKLVALHPALPPLLQEEQQRLEALIGRRKAASTLERSLALVALGDAIIASYERMKSHRGLLDFDDLIEKTRQLLFRAPSWVLYKLDQQVDHVLLDEAQDTSARQWEILASIVGEFCSGAGARQGRRTFFAVGDEKQSIFSFQGAAPKKFDAMRRDFERQFNGAELAFGNVSLTWSFRSAPKILEAVDRIFANAENRRGLSPDPQDPAPEHQAFKRNLKGLVEIWKLAGAGAAEAPADWLLPLDYVGDDHPATRLASKIARKIGALLSRASEDRVADGAALRPVAPGDIMILVRKRDAFFEAMIRALKAEHIPVAGADRLDLASHIAVMDLCALARAALLRDDDLMLATALKTPLLGLDDDDLIAIAPERDGSLFSALHSSSQPHHRAAAAAVERFSQDARALAPFDFFAKLLGAGGGRKKLLARLGAEANDAIDELLRLALGFERSQSCSLVDFLAMIDALDLSVKRDMEAAGGAVRVMTVHAAKGLEARIVFLPDTCGAPSARHDPKLFLLGEENADAALAWSSGKTRDAAAVLAAREALRENAREEYQRLLYVALTRAEERLYVAGYHGQTAPAPGCWYHAIRGALEDACTPAPDAHEEGAEVLRFGEGASGGAGAQASPAIAPLEIPAFALTPAPVESVAAPPVRPSTFLQGADTLARSNELNAPSRQESERLLVGRLTHALLQHLPRCAAERRAAAAQRFLVLRAPQLAEAQRAAMAQAAIALVDDPALAPLFGPDSSAEVDLAARIEAPRGTLAISGRIDRLAITESEVFIADFKTGGARVGDDALRQLALYRAGVRRLYPHKRMRCVLVFTQDASVVEPGDAQLDAALAQALADAI